MTGLPPDSHTHTQWSWDATAGDMVGSCARAVELGLPAIAFTEHVDITRWVIPPDRQERMTVHGRGVASDGRFDPPPLDVDGYRASLEHCRERFPELRILSGVELGEPHWFPDEVDELLASGAFDRILGSQHTVELDGRPWIVDSLDHGDVPPDLTPEAIVRAHLSEMLELVTGCDRFEVLAHVDYAVRRWPDGPAAFPVTRFEEEFREVLRALAGTDRTLELNTVIPLDRRIVAWWVDVGGRTLTFGSDAHAPAVVGHGLAEAAGLARSLGFRPGRHPSDPWHR
ncbi:MAG: PHP domain-containing protein [Actinobacteria bacterium]|nr:PHP domain-containing protein [Actinomycetota bacterium]